MSNRKSEESRALQNERRATDRIRTGERHNARNAKYAPTRGTAGAW